MRNWRELNVNHSIVIGHLKQIVKVKKLDKWVPHGLTKKKNFLIVILKCHLPFFYKTTNHFSIWLWYVKKSGFYTTTSDDQLSGWTKKKHQSISQSQTCIKRKKKEKVIVSVRQPAPHLIHYSLLNPSKTTTSEKYAQKINEMHWKLQHLQPA